MSFRIRQATEYRGEDWWDWEVWLDGPSKELDAIRYVEYTLHSTFPDPVRRVSSRKTGFKLRSSGWGEFEIVAKIVPKQGRPRLRLHWLELRKRKPAKTTKKARASVTRSGKRKAAAAPPPGPHKRTVFVSSGAADADAARRLRDDLSALGIEVTTPESGVSSLRISLGSALKAADTAIFLLSDRPGLWMQEEIQRAKELGTRIVPVLVGEGVELPSPLAEIQAVRVASRDDIGGLAKAIAAGMSRHGDPHGVVGTG
jgi:hypothetical protein